MLFLLLLHYCCYLLVYYLLVESHGSRLSLINTFADIRETARNDAPIPSVVSPDVRVSETEEQREERKTVVGCKRTLVETRVPR